MSYEQWLYTNTYNQAIKAGLDTLKASRAAELAESLFKKGQCRDVDKLIKNSIKQCK